MSPEDRKEVNDRALTVIAMLARCSEELTRLESVPNDNPADVNTLSAALGYSKRAHTLLIRRFR